MPTADLYRLLPEHHRIQDQDGALKALLDVVAEQVDVVKRDVDGLLDDLFIETCADWVVPYIGDLVGNRALPAGMVRPRADVAKTLHHRRRKGTLPMLEEMARNVTRWRAHAVAAFELLGWTQALDHPRFEKAPNPTPATVAKHVPPPDAPVNVLHPGALTRVGTAHVRDAAAMDLVGTPWDQASYTVDVRPPSTPEGWHNVANVLFFLWRLKSYPLRETVPREIKSAGATKGTRFTFSALGNDAPLFNVGEEEMAEHGLAEERHVPGPIRPMDLHLDLKKYCATNRHLSNAKKPVESERYYGETLHEDGHVQRLRRFVIRRKGADGWYTVPAWRIRAMDLSAWAKPPRGIVGVDARLGRLALHPADKVESETRLRVHYAYGFSDDMGGGPYDRKACLAQGGAGVTRITVAKEGPADFRTLARALEHWDKLDRPHAIVEILDSARYRERVRIETWRREPAPAGETQSDWRTWLVIQAAEGQRPNLRLGDIEGNRTDLNIHGDHPNAVLTFNGLLIEGGIHVQGGIAELNFEHCTLVPGRALASTGVPEDATRPSIRQTPDEGSPSMAVNITSCMVGGLRLPEGGTVCIRDSIVHAPKGPALSWDPKPGETDPQPGPALTIERSTVVGPVHARQVDYASETIFHDPVDAVRLQSGCVRYSHVPEGSRTPRRYRCEPDLSLEGVTDETEKQRIRDALRPVHTSLRYGDPGYGQLSELCARALRRGGEDGAEMGAFARLDQPFREEALRLRLEEYLPFGLQAGLIFIT